jgi:hypothetical protein
MGKKMIDNTIKPERQDEKEANKDKDDEPRSRNKKDKSKGEGDNGNGNNREDDPPIFGIITEKDIKDKDIIEILRDDMNINLS